MNSKNSDNSDFYEQLRNIDPDYLTPQDSEISDNKNQPFFNYSNLSLATIEEISVNNDTNQSVTSLNDIKNLSYVSTDEINNLLKLYEQEDKLEKEKKEEEERMEVGNELSEEIIEDKKVEFVKKKKVIVELRDFEFIINLGKGGYGKVDLYKKKKTGDFFAIKSVDYNLIV